MTSEATARAQAAASARAGPRAPGRAREAPPTYAGLVTRVLAFALDALVIDVVALVTGAVAAVCLSLVHLSSTATAVIAAIGAVAWIVWAIGYFAVFWSVRGQTPGGRVMQIAVQDVNDAQRPIALMRAVERCIAAWLGAIPLFAGYVPIVLGERKRAFHDHVAHTVVVHGDPARAAAPQPEPEQPEIGVLTVDDQASFRSAARAVVRATRGFVAIGEVASGAEAVDAAGALAPQLVLMDVRMPGLDGIEATRRLLERCPAAVVILVSADTLDRLPPGSETCGAAAVLPKQELGPQTLTELWRRHRPSALPG
jgi:two-component system, NarL family, invasion response regulator UvrY